MDVDNISMAPTDASVDDEDAVFVPCQPAANVSARRVESGRVSSADDMLNPGRRRLLVHLVLAAYGSDKPDQ